MTVRQLGSHIRALEDDIDPLKIEQSDSTSTRHAIKRHHLPKLEALRIVEVDRELVQSGERFGTALSVLYFVESQRP